MIVNGRTYRRPDARDRPVVVVCLDGSAFDYIERAMFAGAAPYVQSLVRSKFFRLVDAALPTFTNPNNMSIVTGVPPSVHGISGNFFLDRATGEAVMMNDPSFLRADTILASLARDGARVAVVTAKDKLRALLGHGLDPRCCASAEGRGIDVYSSALSEETLAEGVRLLESACPDVMYLSTSDYVQHKYEPGDEIANRFYTAVDRALAAIDRAGATLVVTADHGMRAKADETGIPRAVYLQKTLDDWLGSGIARVILPITDPYVRHHGSLGSCAMVYVPAAIDASVLAGRIGSLPGVDVAAAQAPGREDDACVRFELPPDRIGDIVVFSDGETVIGTRQADHDLSALDAPLRSHGGRSEQLVPMLANRVVNMPASRRLRNFDAFDIALNACGTS